MRSGAFTLGLVAAAMLMSGHHSADAAVVYCKYIGVPKGCVVRAGVVLRPAPAVAVRVAPGVGAPGVGVAGTPGNRGGPVNRVGRR